MFTHFSPRQFLSRFALFAPVRYDTALYCTSCDAVDSAHVTHRCRYCGATGILSLRALMAIRERTIVALRRQLDDATRDRPPQRSVGQPIRGWNPRSLLKAKAH